MIRRAVRKADLFKEAQDHMRVLVPVKNLEGMDGIVKVRPHPGHHIKLQSLTTCSTSLILFSCTSMNGARRESRGGRS